MIVTNKEGQVKLLKRAATNDRMLRHRPEGSIKNAALIISDPQRKEDKFADTFGEFG